MTIGFEERKNLMPETHSAEKNPQLLAVSALLTVLIDELVASKSIDKDRLVATLKAIGDINNSDSAADPEVKYLLTGFADIISNLRNNNGSN
jgi:hypothetical protein